MQLCYVASGEELWMNQLRRDLVPHKTTAHASTQHKFGETCHNLPPGVYLPDAQSERIVATLGITGAERRLTF